MSDYDGEFQALVHAATSIVLSPKTGEDDGLRAAAEDFLRTQFESYAHNPDGPEDDPAQTDAGEGDPEPAE